MLTRAVPHLRGVSSSPSLSPIPADGRRAAVLLQGAGDDKVELVATVVELRRVRQHAAQAAAADLAVARLKGHHGQAHLPVGTAFGRDLNWSGPNIPPLRDHIAGSAPRPGWPVTDRAAKQATAPSLPAGHAPRSLARTQHAVQPAKGDPADSPPGSTSAASVNWRTHCATQFA